jgi:hypothetical protein
MQEYEGDKDRGWNQRSMCLQNELSIRTVDTQHIGQNGMRTGNLHFPGLDKQTSEQLAADVAADQEAVLTAIRNLREEVGMSLEALGFVLGCDAAHLSRHLKGMSITTLTNYIRVPRALGYRCRVEYERVDRTSAGNERDAELAILHRKVLSPRAVMTRRR